MAIAANQIPPGEAGDTRAFQQQLEDLLATYLPELQADIGLAGATDVPAEQPLAGDELDQLLARFGQGYPGEDRRAVVSVWGQWYLRTLWPPLVTAALSRGCLPASPAVAIRPTADARPALMRIAPGGLISGSAEALLEELVRTHAAGIVETLAARGGFSPRVLWSVVGAMHRWTLATLRERGADFPLAPADRLLTEEAFDDGSPNPLHGTQQPGQSEQRRVCCLRYRIDAMPYCADCPIAARSP